MDRFPILPNRGATNGSSFKGTPPDMAPLEAIRNYRPDGVDTDRPRGSKRACLRKLFNRQLKAAPVQAVAVLSRASGQVGLSLGECNDLEGFSSTPAGPLVGQFTALDDVPSMDWLHHLDVTPAGGPANNSVSQCAMSPDGEFMVVASNYPVAGDGRFTIQRLNLDGDVIWTNGHFSAAFQVFCNGLVVTKLYTIAVIANTNPAAGQPKVIVYRNDTGAKVLEHDLFSWARQAVAIAKWTDVSGNDFVFIAFDGQATAGTYTGGIGGGTIQAGRWAMQFRAGIMKFKVDSDAYGGSVLTRQTFGVPASPGDSYYEAAHGYWRFSEQSLYKPKGCEFTALACGDDGSVYFTKRNQGWGPNNTSPFFYPNENFGAYATVGKISPTGQLMWLQDTDSIRELDDLGFYNDLTYPGDASPDPSLFTIAVDPDGNSYVGGRRTASAFSIFSLSTDGVPRWAKNLMPALDTRSIRKGAIAYDDSDGTVVFGGDRNDSWDGAAGDMAHLWKVKATNGSVVWAWDLEENVSALWVGVNGAGRTFYGHDFVS